MTPRTRYFLFGSVAFLLIGLCTGVVAFYSGLPMGAFGQQDTPSELSYVPADAAVVAYCNVQDVMHSQLRQTLQRNMPNHEEGQRQFEQETGLNIERDIDRIVGFLVPTGTKDGYRGMVVASGRFDVVRLEGLARQHGGDVTDYKGKRMITRVVDEGTDRRAKERQRCLPEVRTRGCWRHRLGQAGHRRRRRGEHHGQYGTDEPHSRHR